RGDPVVPADGVGGRPHLLVRPVHRDGVRHQLPGERRHGPPRLEGDRADLLLRPPRIWETILTNVMVRVEDCAWPTRRLVDCFLRLAQAIEQARLNRAPVPVWRRLLAPLGHLLVGAPLRDNLGLRRLRRAYTAGEAIGP